MKLSITRLEINENQGWKNWSWFGQRSFLITSAILSVFEEPQKGLNLDFALALLREDHVAQVLALRCALPGDLGRRAGRVAAGGQMKLLDQHPVHDVQVLVEGERDSVAALDVLELLDLNVLRVLNALLLLGAQDATDQRLVNEGGRPKVWNLESLSQFVNRKRKLDCESLTVCKRESPIYSGNWCVNKKRRECKTLYRALLLLRCRSKTRTKKFRRNRI